MNLLSIQGIADHYGVTIQTIRNWEREGKLKSVRTFGGHRRFEIDDDLPAYSAGKAGKMLGLHEETLTRWHLGGKIECSVTEGGHRRFSKNDIERIKQQMSEMTTKERQ